jgi:tetratricopeptide (TPR) repeat protein
MISPLRKYEPKRNELCTCGSGRKFKKCCMEDYSSGAQEKAFEKYNKGLYAEALTACRHHLTWYILCHNAHTVPFLSSGTKESSDLLTIDIEALADLVGLLHRCYFKTGQSEEFPSSLDRLVNAVDDLRWRDKVVYFRALWWLLDKDDRNSALSIVSEIDIEACKDPEILALYLDVSPQELAFKTRVAILDRIIANTHKDSYKLQYTVLKGIAYCLINDVNQGCQIIKEAADDYRKLNDKNRTPYGDMHLAHALQILGEFLGDGNTVLEAVTQYEAILQEVERHEYAEAYAADVKKSLGDCLSFLKEYHKAVKYYRESLRHEDADLTRVFLSRAYVNLSDPESSRGLLKSIDASQFDENSHYDYAISWAILATNSLLSDDLEMAKAQLKQAKSNWPLFIGLRDSTLIQLLETVSKKPKSKLKDLIGLLNRYVSLNPNLFGIGINFNKIVEDVDRKDVG